MLMDVPARETGRWLQVQGERRADFFEHDEKPEGLLYSQRTCWARSEALTLLDGRRELSTRIHGSWKNISALESKTVAAQP